MSELLNSLHQAHVERRLRLFGCGPRPLRMAPRPPMPVQESEVMQEMQQEQPQEAVQELPVKNNLLPGITIKRVIWTVCQHFDGVTPAKIIGPRRQVKLVVPRHLAMLITREMLPGKSYPEIGRQFGGRDHTTVLYACESCERRLLTNPGLAEKRNLICAELLAEQQRIGQ